MPQLQQCEGGVFLAMRQHVQRLRGRVCVGVSEVRRDSKEAGTGEEWGAEDLVGCCQDVGVHSGYSVNTQGPEQRREG